MTTEDFMASLVSNSTHLDSLVLLALTDTDLAAAITASFGANTADADIFTNALDTAMAGQFCGAGSV